MENYIGDPDSQNQFWEYQVYGDTCAIAAQTSILNQYLDHPVSLDEALYVSYANDWYVPGGGTSPEDVGNLLNAYGIPTHSVAHGTVEQLAAELQQGHSIVVGVNSGQLWDQGPTAEFWNWVVKAFGFDILPGIEFSENKA